MHLDRDLFGKKILKARQKHRLTQKELCEICKISENTLRRIENGKVFPREDTAHLLCEALILDYKELLYSCRVDILKEYE